MFLQHPGASPGASGQANSQEQGSAPTETIKNDPLDFETQLKQVMDLYSEQNLLLQ
jgi:hypothetical protein